MLKFIFFRMLQAIPVLLIVIAVTFILIRQAPGGPFDSEKAVSPYVLEKLNERYHLDDPLYQQFFDYLGNAVTGDFGPSFKYPTRSVSEMIFTGLPITFELAINAMVVALIIGISAGLIAALRPNTAQDYIPMSAAMIGICMPSFLMGPLLVLVFGIWLEWLPVSGWGYSAGDKILPSITLGATYAAYIARLSRGGMLEILSQDFIRTARAKGIPEHIILFKHALRGG
jgi:oligopeptide transport system permease protein